MLRRGPVRSLEIGTARRRCSPNAPLTRDFTALLFLSALFTASRHESSRARPIFLFSARCASAARARARVQLPCERGRGSAKQRSLRRRDVSAPALPTFVCKRADETTLVRDYKYEIRAMYILSMLFTETATCCCASRRRHRCTFESVIGASRVEPVPRIVLETARLLCVVVHVHVTRKPSRSCIARRNTS